MTDKFHSLTVVLEKDIREDDAEPIINAIRMVKGVLTATPHIADVNFTVAQSRARRELRKALAQLIV